MADVSVPAPVSGRRGFDPFRIWRGRIGSSPAEFAVRCVPALLYMAGIFLMSSVPGKDLPPGVDDRIAHSAEYFFFGIVLAAAAAGFVPRTGWRVLAATWGFAVLYGVTDEIHQAFVPGRTPSFRDLGFDALGVSVSLLALSGVARRSAGR